MPQEARDKPGNAIGKDPISQEFHVLNESFSTAVREELHPISYGLKPAIQPVGLQPQPQGGESPRYEVDLDEPKSIKLNGSFLNGHVKFNSLEVDDLSFNADQNTKTLSNIKGLSLNLTVFDSNRTMQVEQAQLTVDGNGAKIIDARIENPLPEPVQRILGMPDTIRVEVPLTRDGLVTPRMSQVFADASASTGPSIAGLLAADVLNEAAKVSLFVETNPEWVGNVVEPALHEIYSNLSKFTEPPPELAGQKEEVVQVGPGQQSRPPQITPPGHAATIPQSQIQRASFTPAPLTGIASATQAKPEHGDHRETVKIKGADRNYTVHVPPSYNGQTPMPLVIALHGHAQSGQIIAESTKLNELADKEGFIAVYPDATTWAGEEAWRAWDTDNGLIPPGKDADDVSFLRTIIDKAESDYKIDPNRIYMAGLSNGGMMSFRAAGELSDKIAAIAVVSGAMSGIEPAPRHQISVLNIHGTADRIVPYDGLRNVPSSLTSIGLPKFKSMQYATDFWVGQNKITDPPLILENNGVVERRFINSQTGTEVNEYTILNGRHVPPNFGAVTNTVWNFFEAHPKSTGLASGIPQPREDEPFNITERVKKHFATRGMRGIEKDVGQMVNELHNLKDRTFTPAHYLTSFERKIDVTIDDEMARLVKATEKVSKDGERIDIDYSGTQRIALPLQDTGFARIRAINMDDTSFKLTKRNNLPMLSEISGVSVELSAMGGEYSIPIRSVSQNLDGNGDPYYRIGADNPLPKFAQTIMFSKPTVPVNLRLNEHGGTTVLNESEIKDATLGWNPVTRGYIDVASHGHEMLTRPSWVAGAHTTKDIAILGGSGYGGWKLANAAKMGRRGKIGAAVGLGMVAAPAIIHGLERLLD